MGLKGGLKGEASGELQVWRKGGVLKGCLGGELKGGGLRGA